MWPGFAIHAQTRGDKNGFNSLILFKFNIAEKWRGMACQCCQLLRFFKGEADIIYKTYLCNKNVQ